MPASASVGTNHHAAVRRRRSGEREAPGSARAAHWCWLDPAPSEPLLRFSVARYSGDRADLLETNRILLGQLFDPRDVVTEGAEIERSTAADGAQINHLGDRIESSTVRRNPAHLPGLRAPAGDASARRQRRAGRGELSAQRRPTRAPHRRPWRPGVVHPSPVPAGLLPQTAERASTRLPASVRC